MGFHPAAWGALAWMLAWMPNAGAMTFASRSSGGVTVVHASGPVEPGDADRLTTEIMLAPPGSQFVLRVHSLGGSVVAGESAASVVVRHRVAVVVGDGDACASACFLLFAASPVRMVADGGRVGVHSAAEADGETMASLAATTVMARSAAGLGVPDAIVGRMVTTAPGAMAWLTRAELHGLGARFVTKDGAKVEPRAGGEAGPAREGAAPRPAVRVYRAG